MSLDRFRVLVVLTGLLVPGLASAASMEDQVKAGYAAWDAAFNKADAKAIGAMYTDDATLLPPSHEVHKGPAGAEKFFSGLFAAGVSGHKLDLIEATGDDRMVVAAAKWSANGKDASGAPAAFGGVATHVFEKQADGSLKLRLQTFN